MSEPERTMSRDDWNKSTANEQYALYVEAMDGWRESEDDAAKAEVRADLLEEELDGCAGEDELHSLLAIIHETHGGAIGTAGNCCELICIDARREAGLKR